MNSPDVGQSSQPAPSENPNTDKQPFFKKIDLTGAIDKDEQLTGILRALNQLGAYRPDLLYRGFDGRRIGKVRNHGTDRIGKRNLFAMTEAEWREANKSLTGDLNPLEYTDITHDYRVDTAAPVALSVYKPDGLERTERDYEYKFMEGVEPASSLVGVFLLKD